MVKLFFSTALILLIAFSGRAQNLESAVPMIHSFKENGMEELGAGIIVGYGEGKAFLLTAYHVVKESKSLKIEFRQGWQEYEGRLFSKVQEELDVAVVEVSVPEGELAFVSLQMGEMENLLAGQVVMSIGHPTGSNSKWLRNTQNSILSTEYNFDPRRMSLEPKGITPGCSGGPVFKDGDLIGMLTETTDAEALAVKAGLFSKILKAWQIPTNLLVNERGEGEPLTLEWWNSLTPLWRQILSGRSGDRRGAFLGEEFIEFGENPTPDNLRLLAKADRIYLSKADVKSLAPLGRLKNLTWINCSHTSIYSLQPLKELKGTLKYLDCDNTNISSLLPLKKLTTLEELSIVTNRGLKSLEGLEGLYRLKKLSCGGTSITSLLPLKGLTNLEELSVIFCDELTSLEGIEKLHELKKLYCKNLSITSLLLLKGLTNLEELDVSFCSKLTSSEGIEKLHLKYLNIFWAFDYEIRNEIVKSLRRQHPDCEVEEYVHRMHSSWRWADQ